MILNELHEAGKLNFTKQQKFLNTNTQYLTVMGSVAYGVSQDFSDMDIYGWTIPPKDMVFPYASDKYLYGFSTKPQGFEQWQQHHIKYKHKEYDFAVYSILKYFRLAMDATPNVLDSLYTPRNCVLHSTAVSELVRENRDLFLSRKAWHSYKGYSFSQISKMNNRKNAHELLDVEKFEADFDIPHTVTYDMISRHIDHGGYTDLEHLSETELRLYRDMFRRMKEKSKRYEGIKIHGIDCKNAYHVVRLMLQIEQVLTEGTMSLDVEGRRQHMAAIRNGEWTGEQIQTFFEKKEAALTEQYTKAAIPYKPDEEKIKELLLNCLEHHYGSLDKCVVKENSLESALKDIANIAGKFV